jgi:hypothetical protein
MDKFVANRWDQFCALVLPPNCSTVQRVEMRRAFYAGAQAFQRIMLDELAQLDDKAAAKMMLAIDGEFARFGREVAQGLA